MSQGHWCPTARHFDFEDFAYSRQVQVPLHSLSLKAFLPTLSARTHFGQAGPLHPNQLLASAVRYTHFLGHQVLLLLPCELCSRHQGTVCLECSYKFRTVSVPAGRFIRVGRPGFVTRLLRSLLARLGACFRPLSFLAFGFFLLDVQCRQASSGQPVRCLDVCNVQLFSTVSRIFLFSTAPCSCSGC